MGFVKKKNFNILFILLIVAFILILLSLNNRISAYINGEPPPKRLIHRALDTYFEK